MAIIIFMVGVLVGTAITLAISASSKERIAEDAFELGKEVGEHKDDGV